MARPSTPKLLSAWRVLVVLLLWTLAMAALLLAAQPPLALPSHFVLP